MANDFNFEDSYKPPTEEFIRKSLLHGLLLDDENKPVFLSKQASFYSESDMEKKSRNKGWFTRKLIKVVYENKEKIKAISIFSRLDLSIKKRAMNKVSLNSTFIDPSEILGLSVDDFIRELYILALGRTPDTEGLNSARHALHAGLPKVALIYTVCTSEEFANRAQVAHLKQYRKLYSRYLLNERLKRLPLIGRFCALVALPSRINSLSLHIESLEALLHTEQEKIISNIDRSIDFIDRKITDADRKITDADRKITDADRKITDADRKITDADRKITDADRKITDADRKITDADRKITDIISAIDVANQNIINANVKLDNTALLITETSNKNRPVVYGLPGGVAAVQTKEFVFGVPSEEWRLAVYLSSGGTFEPGTEKYFCSILKEGMHVLDIGANLGIYTLHALAAGCYVYSYEPTPRIYKILLGNIGINGFEPTGRANVYNLAVSDIEGEVEFNIFDTSGHNSMFAKSEPNKVIKVRTVSLDSHLKNLNHIDVVKIDVEGAEALVLRGMKKMITNNPDIKIIMEFAPSNLKHSGIEPDDFIRVIRSMDMDIQLIDEKSGEILDINDEKLCKAYSVNVLLQRNHLKAAARV